MNVLGYLVMVVISTPSLKNMKNLKSLLRQEKQAARNSKQQEAAISVFSGSRMSRARNHGANKGKAKRKFFQPEFNNFSFLASFLCLLGICEPLTFGQVWATFLRCSRILGVCSKKNRRENLFSLFVPDAGAFFGSTSCILASLLEVCMMCV